MHIAIILIALYLAVGVGILVYDVSHDEDSRDCLQEHGWPLVAVMALTWPVFVYMWATGRLND